MNERNREFPCGSIIIVPLFSGQFWMQLKLHIQQSEIRSNRDPIIGLKIKSLPFIEKNQRRMMKKISLILNSALLIYLPIKFDSQNIQL